MLLLLTLESFATCDWDLDAGVVAEEEADDEADEAVDTEDEVLLQELLSPAFSPAASNRLRFDVRSSASSRPRLDSFLLDVVSLLPFDGDEDPFFGLI